jgi:hypothetical protein
MREIDGRIVWAPRVSRKKIRHLYKSEARGMLDERLTAEVAYALLDRCLDMIIATRAHQRTATCPTCSSEITHDWDKSALLECRCGWSMSWGDYLSSYQGRQLTLGAEAPGQRRRPQGSHPAPGRQPHQRKHEFGPPVPR